MGKEEKIILGPGKAHLNKFWFNMVIHAARIGKLLYNLRYEGIENIPGQGPVIILAKHQQYMDSLIIAMAIRDEVDRYATYFIKHSLPDFMETKLGGIKFFNVENYKDLIKKCGKSEASRLAKEYNAKSYQEIKKVLEEDRIILMYPEGGIKRKKMGEIKRHPIKLFKQMEEELSKRIPIVPIGIEYENWYKELFCCPPSKIILRVGKPRYFDEGPLEKFYDGIFQDLKSLSGL